MIDFKEIELKDKEWVDECLKQANFQGCEYSFTSNYIWKDIYHPKIAKVEGFYCLRSNYKGRYSYCYPAGQGDAKKVISLLVQDAKENGIRFRMHGITEGLVEQMEEWFPGVFHFDSSRDDSDYIYTVEKLSTLAGKKLHAKRNHINRFKDTDDWEYYDVTKENVHECIEMNQEWLMRYVSEEDEGLQDEAKAVKQILDHFDELYVKGGILKRNGKIVAYTIGEPINDNTYVIHIEKAFYEVQGAYPMINQQFVLHNCQDYEYVNREEDTGDEGLRKAKLSYYPDILLDKYVATLKESE